MSTETESLPLIRSHSLFGFILGTDFPLTLPISAASQQDLFFACTSASPIEWSTDNLVYRSPDQQADTPVAELYRFEGVEILRLLGSLDFFLWRDRIVAFPRDSIQETSIEPLLLGPVLAYWLEQRGLPTLHASAVAVNCRAVAFLSQQGSGKTGLAAAMMREGYPLLTDDVLSLKECSGTFFGQPSYPQMRMWPDEAAWFVERWEELPLIQPGISKRQVDIGTGGLGTFQEASLPLTCIYLPERRPEGPIEIIDVPPRDALIELVRHSFSPHLVAAAGLQPSRFDLFARLVQQVPVRRLRYPSGFERLPEVTEVLLRRPHS